MLSQLKITELHCVIVVYRDSEFINGTWKKNELVDENPLIVPGICYLLEKPNGSQ
jgi:hypothetical protein